MYCQRVALLKHALGKGTSPFDKARSLARFRDEQFDSVEWVSSSEDLIRMASVKPTSTVRGARSSGLHSWFSAHRMLDKQVAGAMEDITAQFISFVDQSASAQTGIRQHRKLAFKMGAVVSVQMRNLLWDCPDLTAVRQTLASLKYQLPLPSLSSADQHAVARMVWGRVFQQQATKERMLPSFTKVASRFLFEPPKSSFDRYSVEKLVFLQKEDFLRSVAAQVIDSKYDFMLQYPTDALRQTPESGYFRSLASMVLSDNPVNALPLSAPRDNNLRGNHYEGGSVSTDFFRAQQDRDMANNQAVAGFLLDNVKTSHIEGAKQGVLPGSVSEKYPIIITGSRLDAAGNALRLFTQRLHRQGVGPAVHGVPEVGSSSPFKGSVNTWFSLAHPTTTTWESYSTGNPAERSYRPSKKEEGTGFDSVGYVDMYYGWVLWLEMAVEGYAFNAPGRPDVRCLEPAQSTLTETIKDDSPFCKPGRADQRREALSEVLVRRVVERMEETGTATRGKDGRPLLSISHLARFTANTVLQFDRLSILVGEGLRVRPAETFGEELMEDVFMLPELGVSFKLLCQDRRFALMADHRHPRSAYKKGKIVGEDERVLSGPAADLAVSYRLTDSFSPALKPGNREHLARVSEEGWTKSSLALLNTDASLFTELCKNFLTDTNVTR